MQTYTNVKSFLKAIKKISSKQEIKYMRGFDKLPKEIRDEVYYIIAGMQNGISTIEDYLGCDLND